MRSDQATLSDIERARAGALVLSPGPGGPTDAGICVEAGRAMSSSMPILGVCLGHQAVAAAFGGKIERGDPCHGKAWTILHEASGLFSGIPSPFLACRYHSLVVRDAGLPGELRADAWTQEGVVMSIRHVERPTFGVQFHPESILTEVGHHLLQNFVSTCESRTGR